MKVQDLIKTNKNIDDKEKFAKTINERLVEVQREVYRQIEERASQDEKGNNTRYKSLKENIEDVNSLMQSIAYGFIDQRDIGDQEPAEILIERLDLIKEYIQLLDIHYKYALHDWNDVDICCICQMDGRV